MNIELIEITKSQIVQNFGCLYINDYIDDLLVSLNELRLPSKNKHGLIVGSLDQFPQGNYQVVSYKEFLMSSIHWDSVSVVIFLNADRLYDFSDLTTKKFIQSPIRKGCYKIFVYPTKKTWKYKDTELYLPDLPEKTVYTSKRLSVFGVDSTEDIYLKYFNGFKFPQSSYVRRGKFSKKRGISYVMRLNSAMVLPLYIMNCDTTGLKPSSSGTGRYLNMDYKHLAYDGLLKHRICAYFIKEYIETKKKRGIPALAEQENVVSLQNFFLHNYVSYCAKLSDCAKLKGVEEKIKSIRFRGLEGVPDFWSYSEDGTLEIVDLKTGHPSKVANNRQLQLYTILITDKYPQINNEKLKIKHTLFNRNESSFKIYERKHLTEFIQWYTMYKGSVI